MCRYDDLHELKTWKELRKAYQQEIEMGNEVTQNTFLLKNAQLKIDTLKMKLNQQKNKIMIETKSHEYCVFVFRRGNSFNGHKLNEDGSIIHTIEVDHDMDYNRREYINTTELTIEHKYGEEANSEAYNFLSSVFTDGDILKITCTIDENGVFNKRIEKVMDKVFCENTKKSWDSIKHHWFHPQKASERLEAHLTELQY